MRRLHIVFGGRLRTGNIRRSILCGSFCCCRRQGPANCKIGVIQLTEHVALDAARDGFIDALVEAGFNRENIDVQNAQGEIPNCATIATKFVNDKVDLILAVATPAAQAAAQATTEIPILATAVTDFVSAGLVNSDEVPGGNVSGTSDMNPIEEQADLLVKLVPEAKTVGILYCSAEDNSILQAGLAKAAFEARGLTVNEYTAADVNEIQPVTTKAVGEVDALYVPTDNLFAENMPTAALVAGECQNSRDLRRERYGGFRRHGHLWHQLL